jgi:hypothetical protein
MEGQTLRNQPVLKIQKIFPVHKIRRATQLNNQTSKNQLLNPIQDGSHKPTTRQFHNKNSTNRTTQQALPGLTGFISDVLCKATTINLETSHKPSR